MSEKTAVGYARELVASLWHSFPEDAEQPIAEAIAAAEERGRRAGIEEARKAIANEANGNRGGDYERRLRMLAELVMSLDLAPRDSGKGG